ncbi:MAG: hypothetical protein FWC89_02465 [Defluviitaleaceae bacterium]|nr:hypothetical protein [Defluviitaleaceae bacterium]
MLFRRLKKNVQPTVTSVSKLINRKPYKEKKYLTLMLVPAYSTGRTISLRFPRWAFHGLIYGFAIICMFVAGFYIRSNYFIQTAQELSVHLDETMEAFAEYRADTEAVQSDLVYAATHVYEQLGERQRLSREEMANLERRHQYDFNDIWEHIDMLENIVHQFDSERIEMIEHLRARSIIPPLAALLGQLEYSQANIRGIVDVDEYGEDIPQVVRFLATNEDDETLSSDALLERVYLLLEELDIQQLLLEDINYYNNLMNYYEGRMLGFRVDRTSEHGVELIPWSYARRLFRLGTAVRITDVRTGESYYVSSFSNGNHADVRPLTADDTAIMFRTFGGVWSWNTRPVLVHIDDRTFAASINGMPHGGGSIPGNNMRGHICIHFYGSRTHSGSRSHEIDHQNSVREAFRASPR